MLGWAIDITNIQEDSKYNQTNHFFDGLYGRGKHEGTSNPEVLYKIDGTSKNPSDKLQFVGKYTTEDRFFSERIK